MHSGEKSKAAWVVEVRSVVGEARGLLFAEEDCEVVVCGVRELCWRVEGAEQALVCTLEVTMCASLRRKALHFGGHVVRGAAGFSPNLSWKFLEWTA